MSFFNEEQQDLFKELVNIGMGRSAAALNHMLNARVELVVPEVHVLHANELKPMLEKLGQDVLSIVQMSFSGALKGGVSLVFPTDSAFSLVNALVPAQDDSRNQFDSLKAGVLVEIGNIVLNGMMGSISNFLSHRLYYTVPNYTEERIPNLFDQKDITPEHTIIYTLANFRIKELMITGSILIVLDLESSSALKESIDTLLDIHNN